MRAQGTPASSQVPSTVAAATRNELAEVKATIIRINHETKLNHQALAASIEGQAAQLAALHRKIDALGVAVNGDAGRGFRMP